MAGRLAVDFGTSNTVVAVWDSEREDGHSVTLSGLSTPDEHDGREFHVVPSLIHYDGPRVRVGRQVLDEPGLRTAQATFQWMKLYVANGMKLPRRFGERSVDFFQAAEDFLRQVLVAAGAYSDLAEEEVAFPVPVEAFEHYQNWLDGVVASAGVRAPRFIDEPSAAALGYSARIRSGEAFTVFDFGGGTADASIVKVEEDAGGRRCRMLGKAGAQVGGTLIDQWIVRDVLSRVKRTESQTRPLMGLLLEEAERVKKALSKEDSQNFLATDPVTGAVITHRYSRGAFEDRLEENGLYAKLNTIFDLAEAQAREHGHDRDSLRACLMIGGCSLLPSVRRMVRTRYGDRAHCTRPFDAVAVGAAAYAAGAGFDDRVRHAYALRPYDRQRGDYVYETIVPAGTPYPCTVMRPDRPEQPLVIAIKASHDEQTKLGLQIYEVAHKESVACGSGGMDLVYDQNGGARYVRRQDVEDATHRPIGSPTFLLADPPAKMGHPRFQATFSIDGRKYLCVTVRDNQTGRTLMCDYPMVKLT